MFILTESGRVLNDTGDPSTRVLELVNGVWGKPLSPVLFTELMDGRELSEEEVENFAKSGSVGAN